MINKKIKDLVMETLNDFNETNKEGITVKLDPKSKLTGSNSVLDSIALINLLLELEKKILKKFKKKITIVDQNVFQDKKTLSSVKNLILHIEKKINE